ncbi:MAG: gamma-glutamylcyclotransferase [Bdellovibrionaceae bacterium]|nr:gamma-glutamylcyclotransferase [Pseudobdellovibrionaceae bacterium]
MSTNSVFICDALTGGDLFLNKVQNLIVSSEEATVQGAVYRSKVGFPFLAKSGTDSVQGLLVRLNPSDMCIHILDELMGFFPQNPAQGLTHREVVKVSTSNGSVEAFVYFLNSEKISSELKYIENGDWQRVLVEKPPLPQKLTERQRNYIQKLGKSSGRDIVPIDLALYRELMNLELVIDKGRRIALTKLGQEVYRYL